MAAAALELTDEEVAGAGRSRRLGLVGRPSIPSDVLVEYRGMDPEQIEAGRARWQQSRIPIAKRDFTTLSGVEVEPVSGPSPKTAVDPRFDRIGWPGEFPFTRGLHASGYRGKPLDHPAVRRLRQRPADQRALQDDPGLRRWRAVGRLRH